jgi:hypothetical protein
VNFRYLQYSSGSNVTLSPDDSGTAHHINPTASIDVTLFSCYEGARLKIVHGGASNTITVKDGVTTIASLTTGQECYIDARIDSSGVPGWPTGALVVGSNGIIDADSIPATAGGVGVQQAGADVPSSLDADLFTKINFVSGATVTEGSPGVADVTNTGGSGDPGEALAAALL